MKLKIFIIDKINFFITDFRIFIVIFDFDFDFVQIKLSFLYFLSFDIIFYLRYHFNIII